MNLLEIMRQANTFCGLQGDIDTVANLKDIQVDLLNFVRQAYLKIQLASEEWKFMNRTLSLTVDGTTVATSNADVSKWKKVLYDRRELLYVNYDEYLLQDWTQPGPPARYTVVPETNEMVLNKLDGTYSLTCRYLKVPGDLTNNLDIPILPTRFHMLIAYQAAADFGSWLGNPEIEDKNLLNADILMGYMKRSDIPEKYIKITPMA